LFVVKPIAGEKPEFVFSALDYLAVFLDTYLFPAPSERLERISENTKKTTHFQKLNLSEAMLKFLWKKFTLQFLTLHTAD
jgi:hypothetical protein